jgi:hypothetical protein
VCVFSFRFTSNTSIVSINFGANLDTQNARNGISGLKISNIFWRSMAPECRTHTCTILTRITHDFTCVKFHIWIWNMWSSHENLCETHVKLCFTCSKFTCETSHWMCSRVEKRMFQIHMFQIHIWNFTSETSHMKHIISHVFICEKSHVPKSHVQNSHVKFHMWNFTCEISHVPNTHVKYHMFQFHMWNCAKLQSCTFKPVKQWNTVYIGSFNNLFFTVNFYKCLATIQNNL